MKRKIFQFLGMGALSAGLCSAALAQSVLTCFYECKPLPTGAGFQEVTTLMITNSASRLSQPPQRFATLVFVDGNERVLAKAQLSLSPRDLDEVNVCATLELGIGGAPPAGMVQIATILDPPSFPDDTEAVDSWMKNLLGRFQRANPDLPITWEPFESGRVTGIAKTPCERQLDRLVDSRILLADPEVQEAKEIRPILIEKTEDPVIVGAQ